MNYTPLQFKQGKLWLLDQKALPAQKRYVVCHSAQEAARAIQEMTVRGAPLLGQVAAWGLYLDLAGTLNEREWKRRFGAAYQALGRARPTARNLMARLEFLKKRFYEGPGPCRDRLGALKKFLKDQESEWQAITNGMARHGASVLKRGCRALTICNTGRLATLGRGTALAAIEEAHLQGKLVHVYACETRPYLQGLRLTMWELKQLKIPGTLITDSMAAFLMSQGKVDAILTGADRITANGDTANKIGTLSLAILAKHFSVPFYVVAPEETIDRSLSEGSKIPIEERSHDEVTVIAGKRLAPAGTKAWHPAFDVTPHSLITAIITEKTIWRPDFVSETRNPQPATRNSL
ncbi:MAG: S-methyl-5-thioribose-1-phosphate isomerase [Elusimicrobia bacterium]|nr:S-methyl-5-thioribose-1-phosphate isomerase [Elusimicrobiota bacterium]